MDSTTYVIGHKNPDADAICSAIAYAEYKKAIGESSVVPARCGNSNARIDAVLKHFDWPAPVFLGDVRPRARDIMVTDVHRVSIDATCAEALDLIDRYDVRSLPVVEHDGKLAGGLSIFTLGDLFIPKARDLKQIRHVRTSVNDIVRALGASVLNLVDGDRIEDLYVRVGAMDIRSFGRFAETESTKPHESIIVVGDRWDIQQKSIQSGVRLLVITGNLEVAPEVVEMAKERDVSLVVSFLDSATTSQIIRTANRVEPLVEKDVVTFRPEEAVSALQRKMSSRVAPIYMVVDDEGRLLGVVSKSDVIKPSGKKLILVDHNELTQAVNGASEVEIREIVDHHRLGNPPTQQPILFINEPVGSTCTIVAGLFRRDGISLEAPLAGILMSGIISDTLNLQSPTSTPKDKDILQWLEGVSRIGADDLAQIIFSSGSVILGAESMEQVLQSDMKQYDESGVRFSVSQVEELGFDNFWNHAEELSEALKRLRLSENYLFSALLVTDINRQNSLLLVEGPEELIEKINYPRKAKSEIFELSGIVSRKKQLMPYLTSILKSAGLMDPQPAA